MAETNQSVIIVAGGSGSRMQTAIPKQFILLAGEPILMHTIRRFFAYNSEIEIVVVLPENERRTWEELCNKHNFSIKHTVVIGGKTRFQSVKNGLAEIKNPGVVAVHDGVRPFVPVSIIAEAFSVAQEKGNAVTAVELKDSVRKITCETNEAVDRSQFRLIQTPQCFRADLLKKAYQFPEENSFTDDASVVEKTGEKINLVPGNYENIKITTPEDLLWAEVLFSKIGGSK